MNSEWLFFALASPLLWAFTYILDSAVRRCHIKNEWVMTWVASVIRLPIILLFFIFFGFEFPGWFGVGMILAGLLWTLMFVPYLKALELEEASRVALFISLLPIFAFIFGTLLLGETLTSSQGVAFVLIFFGGALAAIKRLKGLWHFSRAFWLMLVASAFWALSDVLFKQFSVEFSGFMPAFALFLAGGILTGVLLPLSPSIRRALKTFSHTKISPKAWAMLLASSLIGIMGSLSFAYALIIGKVALTSVLAQIQPLFVFIFTLLLSRFLKDVSPEEVTPRDLFFKGASFVMIGVALIYLYL